MKFSKALIPIFVFLFAIKSNCEAVTFTSYKIDPAKCHRIITRSGSVIYIPENSFAATGPIEIRYREYQNLEDILLDKISMLHKTRNGTKLLETGGMFEVYAYQNGNKIELKAGQTIDVTFAARKDFPDLKVFYYDHTAPDWLLTDKTFKTEKGSVVNTNPNAATSGKPSLMNPNANNNGDGEGEPEDSVSRRKRIEMERLKASVFRTLSIDKMGLYNYDHIMEDANVLIATIEFRLKNDTKPFPGVIYCIQSSLNTVTYHYNGEVMPLPYAANGKLSFFTILNANTVVKISDQQISHFRRADKKEKITLILDQSYRYEQGTLQAILGY